MLASSFAKTSSETSEAIVWGAGAVAGEGDGVGGVFSEDVGARVVGGTETGLGLYSVAKGERGRLQRPTKGFGSVERLGVGVGSASDD